MSRTRTGHGPLDWSKNDPATPHRFSHAFGAGNAVTIPDMRRVLSAGGNFVETHTGHRQKALSVTGKPR